MDREKQIHKEMYVHSEIIRQEKKILKALRKELEEYYSQKKLIKVKNERR